MGLTKRICRYALWFAFGIATAWYVIGPRFFPPPSDCDLVIIPWTGGAGPPTRLSDAHWLRKLEDGKPHNCQVIFRIEEAPVVTPAPPPFFP